MTCTNPVVVDNRKWMLTRIESRGFSSEKQSGLIYFMKYRKIPKISPGAYIFQRPFLRGLYSEGLIYRGKFAFQNRLG